MRVWLHFGAVWDPVWHNFCMFFHCKFPSRFRHELSTKNWPYWTTKIIDFWCSRLHAVRFSEFPPVLGVHKKIIPKVTKMHSQNHPKLLQNHSKKCLKTNRCFEHFLYQNGPKMHPTRKQQFRKNDTWARWTANSRPMGPQSLQNGAQWTPKAPKMDPRTHKMELWGRQSSQNAPQNCQNETLKDPKASKSTQAKMTNLTLNRKH